MKKLCPYGHEFEAQRRTAVYCSTTCRVRAHNDAKRGLRPQPVLLVPTTKDLRPADLPRGLGRTSRKLVPRVAAEVEGRLQARAQQVKRPTVPKRFQRMAKERIAIEEGRVLATTPLTADEQTRVKMLCAAERAAVDGGGDRQPFVDARNAIVTEAQKRGPHRHSDVARAVVRRMQRARDNRRWAAGLVKQPGLRSSPTGGLPDIHVKH